jgi:hypothetical protein
MLSDYLLAKLRSTPTEFAIVAKRKERIACCRVWVSNPTPVLAALTQTLCVSELRVWQTPTASTQESMGVSSTVLQ